METAIFKVTEYNEELAKLVETVQKTFITKEGLSDLINKSTNDQVINVLADKYVKVDNEWKNTIDEIAHFVLGEFYDSSANVSVDWNSCKVVVEVPVKFITDSKSITDRLSNVGVVTVSVG